MASKKLRAIALFFAVLGFGMSPTAHAAQDLLVSNWFGDVYRFDGLTGVAKGVFADGAGITEGMTLGPDGNLYVSDNQLDRILKFNGSTGAYMGVFASGAPLDGPHGLVFGPDGYLYVSSYWNNQILRYNASTGVFAGVFATGDVFFAPTALALPPGGVLYVCNWFGDIRRFDIASGALLGQFAMDTGVLQGEVFGADGNLYVTDYFYDNLLRYDPSGAFLGAVATGAPMDGPRGVTFGPEGDFYISSYWSRQILHYDWASGAFEGFFVTGDTFFAPTYLMFANVVGSNPVPSIRRLRPGSARAGGGSFQLTVSGAKFVSSSKVKWNNTYLVTTYVSSTSLRAQVPSKLIRKRGTANISVVNPPPGGGTSNSKTFNIN